MRGETPSLEVLLCVDEEGGERPRSAQPGQVPPLEIIERNSVDIRPQVEILHGPEGGVPDVVAPGHHEALCERETGCYWC